MKAALNLFQATMLRWRELHPYNAVHVVRVSERLDGSRLERSASRYLEQCGLTGLNLDRRAGRYEWQGGAATATLCVLPGAADVAEVLRGEIERQLNLAYPPDGRIEPFRFFAVDDVGSFEFGVAYDHFVAGGDVIVGLLRGVIDAYRGADAQSYPGIALYPPTYGRLFRRQAVAVLAGVMRLPGLAAACRRSIRPPYRGDIEDHTGFVSVRLDARECDALTRTAAAWRVTQNDLFLGVLLKSLSPLALRRRQEPRRRELGVASIVNIRRDFGPDTASSFGPVLASFRVSHPVPDDMSMRELVTVVNVETTRVKRGKLYLQTLLALAVAGFEWRFLSVAQRRALFGKHHPVWAGTTPLNVTPLWQKTGDTETTPAYIRAVPTGPLAPISVAVTTAGSNVHVGMSFCTTAFDRATIDALVVDIRQNINNL